MRKRSKLPPTVPAYVNLFYVGAHLLSYSLTSEQHPILHGMCSVLPLFMLLWVLKARLRDYDLGSVMITLSLLAEALGNTTHTT